MNQHEIPGSEDIYTLGNLADTAVVIFKDENSLWTFFRTCPTNKWHTYGSSQIYVGLDNQIRGQRPEEKTRLSANFIEHVFKSFLPNTQIQIFPKLMFIEITVAGRYSQNL